MTGTDVRAGSCRYLLNQQTLDKYHEIYPQNAANIPAIGINIHQKGADSIEDTNWDVIVGGKIDLDMLQYVPDISQNEGAMDAIADLAMHMPEVEPWGHSEEFLEAFARVEDAEIHKLAEEIDKFSEDMFPYEYADSVEDKEANITSIESDLRSRNTEYMTDFINSAVENYIAKGITEQAASGSNDPAVIEAANDVARAQELNYSASLIITSL